MECRGDDTTSGLGDIGSWGGRGGGGGDTATSTGGGGGGGEMEGLCCSFSTSSSWSDKHTITSRSWPVFTDDTKSVSQDIPLAVRVLLKVGRLCSLLATQGTHEGVRMGVGPSWLPPLLPLQTPAQTTSVEAG